MNCNLKGSDNNDFHIPIAREPTDTIFDGIVVEMVPQKRPDRWNIPILKAAAKDKRHVLVRGQPLYDKQARCE